jgi:hypothetical protein
VVFTGYSSSQILTNPISTIGGVGGSGGTFKSSKAQKPRFFNNKLGD